MYQYFAENCQLTLNSIERIKMLGQRLETMTYFLTPLHSTSVPVKYVDCLDAAAAHAILMSGTHSAQIGSD